MAVALNDFIDALGMSEGTSQFNQFVEKIEETPIIETGPLGYTRYYSFYKEGILFSIEDDRLIQISCYIEAHENFTIYKQALCDGVTRDSNEVSVIKLLGTPDKTGGDKLDGLIGYIPRWIKFEKDRFAIHFEFSQSGKLRKMSLILI
ncbi:hypothetical protein [Paraherbaspirillum soli]|uniref:Uncharacterized protein n=1 Tax=Paraherbaspirillum soli TaxID=631222 RepID=A0ABW0MC26_9BURK